MPNLVKPVKRSPLKEGPAPQPGQSLEGQLQSLTEDRIDFWAIFAVGFPVSAALEWARWYFVLRPQPIVMTVLAAVVVGLAVPRIFALRREVRRLRMAIDGEKVVGQFLETLRPRGYLVFHDIAEEGFNIDHALIGPAGVFAIETKTISKPTLNPAKITYDGEEVLIDGQAPTRDPVIQAKAAADHLRSVLERSTGLQRVPVRPVVLYPGWFVEKQPKGVEVWVLNPKALPMFLDYEEEKLTADQIGLLSLHLSRYVQGVLGERTHR